jgi:hypothetical protein
MSAFLLINFTRPEKTAQALENLRWAKDLLLFCDGPKPNRPNTRNTETIGLIKDFARLRTEAGYKTETRFEPVNLGPRLGPLTAIKWFFEQRDRGHIIEDDILVAPGFEAAHDAGLKIMAGNPKLFAVAEGYPLPECRAQWIATKMARLVAWSSHAEKIRPLLDGACARPFPWSTRSLQGKLALLKGLLPKTQLFLWKEFSRLEARPQWSWHYALMQHQLSQGLKGLTPTVRLHENTGIDGSGANCINLFGEDETFSNDELWEWEAKSGWGEDKKAENKMERERYGRIHQALGRIGYRFTPDAWKKVWRPAKSGCPKGKMAP